MIPNSNILNSPIIVRDYETSGLSAIYDQILTSSAKRYKDGVIDDQIYLSCRCESSRLPSPYALMINGHTQQALESGMPLRDLLEADFTFNEKYPGDFILAYNAKFDFNFSFNSYYQGIISPSWYAWKINNKLICALEILKTIYTFKKDINDINIPLDLFSSPNFRLERVCQDNGISYSAHNASEDVDATHQVFELMKMESPEIVTQAFKCANKQFVKNIINFNQFFCTSVGVREELHSRILAPLAWNSQGNEVICCDIAAINPRDISNISSWDVYLQTQEYRLDNWLVKIPINKGKVFFDEEAFSSCYNPSNLGVQQLKLRADALRVNLKFKDVCKGAFTFFEERYASSLFDDSLEKSIFQNFSTPNEAHFINSFNELPWTERWAYINTNNLLDRSNRISRLARKLVLEYDISLAPKNIQRSYIKHCNERLFDINSKKTLPWNNISRVIEEISILKRDRPDDIKRIKDIENYFDARLAIKYI